MVLFQTKEAAMSFLTCPICFDKYNCTIYEPVKFANCGHKYCSSCHMRIAPKTCPVCALNYDHLFLEQSPSLYSVVNAVRVNSTRRVSSEDKENRNVTSSFHGSSDHLTSVGHHPYTIPIHQTQNPGFERESNKKWPDLKSLLPIQRDNSAILSLDHTKYTNALFQNPLPDITRKKNQLDRSQSMPSLKSQKNSNASESNVKFVTPAKIIPKPPGNNNLKVVSGTNISKPRNIAKPPKGKCHKLSGKISSSCFIWLLYNLVFCTMIIMGSINVYKCPAEPNIPIWSILAGSLGLLALYLGLFDHLKLLEKYKFLKFILFMTIPFGFFMLIFGSISIYKIYLPDYENYQSENSYLNNSGIDLPTDSSVSNYCDLPFYIFSFCIVTLIYCIAGLFIISKIIQVIYKNKTQIPFLICLPILIACVVSITACAFILEETTEPPLCQADNNIPSWLIALNVYTFIIILLNSITYKPPLKPFLKNLALQNVFIFIMFFIIGSVFTFSDHEDADCTSVLYQVTFWSFIAAYALLVLIILILIIKHFKKKYFKS